MFFYDPDKRSIAENIEIIAREENLPYLDKKKFLCDERRKICEFLTPNSNFEILFDYSHFSVEGASYLGKKYYNYLKNFFYEKK